MVTAAKVKPICEVITCIQRVAGAGMRVPKVIRRLNIVAQVFRAASVSSMLEWCLRREVDTLENFRNKVKIVPEVLISQEKKHYVIKASMYSCWCSFSITKISAGA